MTKEAEMRSAYRRLALTKAAADGKKNEPLFSGYFARYATNSVPRRSEQQLRPAPPLIPERYNGRGGFRLMVDDILADWMKKWRTSFSDLKQRMNGSGGKKSTAPSLVGSTAVVSHGR